MKIRPFVTLTLLLGCFNTAFSQLELKDLCIVCHAHALSILDTGSGGESDGNECHSDRFFQSLKRAESYIRHPFSYPTIVTDSSFCSSIRSMTWSLYNRFIQNYYSNAPIHPPLSCQADISFSICAPICFPLVLLKEISPVINDSNSTCEAYQCSMTHSYTNQCISFQSTFSDLTMSNPVPPSAIVDPNVENEDNTLFPIKTIQRRLHQTQLAHMKFTNEALHPYISAELLRLLLFWRPSPLLGIDKEHLQERYKTAQTALDKYWRSEGVVGSRHTDAMLSEEYFLLEKLSAASSSKSKAKEKKKSSLYQNMKQEANLTFMQSCAATLVASTEVDFVLYNPADYCMRGVQVATIGTLSRTTPRAMQASIDYNLACHLSCRASAYRYWERQAVKKKKKCFLDNVGCENFQEKTPSRSGNYYVDELFWLFGVQDLASQFLTKIPEKVPFSKTSPSETIMKLALFASRKINRRPARSISLQPKLKIPKSIYAHALIPRTAIEHVSDLGNVNVLRYSSDSVDSSCSTKCALRFLSHINLEESSINDNLTHQVLSDPSCLDGHCIIPIFDAIVLESQEKMLAQEVGDRTDDQFQPITPFISVETKIENYLINRNKRPNSLHDIIDLLLVTDSQSDDLSEKEDFMEGEEGVGKKDEEENKVEKDSVEQQSRGVKGKEEANVEKENAKKKESQEDMAISREFRRYIDTLESTEATEANIEAYLEAKPSPLFKNAMANLEGGVKKLSASALQNVLLTDYASDYAKMAKAYYQKKMVSIKEEESNATFTGSERDRELCKERNDSGRDFVDEQLNNPENIVADGVQRAYGKRSQVHHVLPVRFLVSDRNPKPTGFVESVLVPRSEEFQFFGTKFSWADLLDFMVNITYDNGSRMMGLESRMWNHMGNINVAMMIMEGLKICFILHNRAKEYKC